MKYALVTNGIVQSVFSSDEPKSSFPDIEPYLHEVSDEVQCNWKYEDGNFITNVEPTSAQLVIKVI